MPRTSITEAEINSALLKSATELFLQQGIARTEMKVIAEHAGLSRSTLYRHAEDKNQLAFQVVATKMSELMEATLRTLMAEKITGYEQLKQFYFALTDKLAANVPLLKVINEFDAIFTDEYPDIPAAHDYVTTMQRLQHYTLQLVEAGLRDHTLRPMERPGVFAATLNNTVVGLALRLFPREAHYRQEQHITGRDVIGTAILSILDSARGEG